MKLLIDTNVILDVLLNRTPHYEYSSKVLKLAARDDIELYVSASAITDIFYIANRALKNANIIKKMITKLLDVASVVAVTDSEIRAALESDEWSDFEDAVQYAVASLSGMDEIVTRNIDDYKLSKIPVSTPEQIINKL